MKQFFIWFYAFVQFFLMQNFRDTSFGSVDENLMVSSCSWGIKSLTDPPFRRSHPRHHHYRVYDTKPSWIYARANFTFVYTYTYQLPYIYQRKCATTDLHTRSSQDLPISRTILRPHWAKCIQTRFAMIRFARNYALPRFVTVYSSW